MSKNSNPDRFAVLAPTSRPDPLKASRDKRAIEFAWLDAELAEASRSPEYAAKLFAAMLAGRGHDHGHLHPVNIAVLQAMPYDRYLVTPHWREVAGQCKAKAGGRCQVCNATGELHAHHRTYERRGYELESDLVALCANCHQLFHDHAKLASDADMVPAAQPEVGALSAAINSRRRELGITQADGGF